MNTQAIKSELQPPYALDLENVEIRLKSLIQILGADSLQRSRLGTAPVRGLYRYYDQATGAKRLVAVCGNKIYTKEDADTFKLIGYNTGKAKVTNGSKLVTGVWGTNWDYLLGEGVGAHLSLLVAGTHYPVDRVTSYRELLLESNFSGSSNDSIVYNLVPTINDTNFVDFEFWREALFWSDGDNLVRSWRHDQGFQWDYWVVDSAIVDTFVISGGIDIVFHLDPRYYFPSSGALTEYRDSAYGVVFRDSSVTFGFRKPLTVKTVSGTVITATDSDSGLFVTGPPRIQHGSTDTWCYFVKPRNTLWAFSWDTLYTGVFERVTSPVTNVKDYVDDQATWTKYDFNSGAQVVMFYRDCASSFTDNEYGFRGVINSWTTNDTVKIRVANASLAPDSCLDYMILQLNYYPKANYVRTNNDRLWFSGIKGQPDEVWYTQFLDPYTITTVNTNNPFYFARGDKPYITGLQSISDRLYTFKNRAIWGLSGYDEFDFQRRQVYSDFGSTSPYSLTKYFNDSYLVSEQGLFQFDGQSLTYHSQNIRSYFEDSTVTAMRDNISVAVHEDKAWVGLATTGTFNNTTLLYDFSGYSELPVYNSSSFARFDAPGDNGDLIIGADSGRVYEYGTKDSLNGALPTPLYQSPFIAFNDIATFKRLDQIELTYSMQDSGKIEVSIFKDFGTSAVFTDTIDVIRASHDRAKLDCEAYGYAFSVKFRGINTRKLQISEWGANVVAYGEDENYK